MARVNTIFFSILEVKGMPALASQFSLDLDGVGDKGHPEYTVLTTK